MITESLAMRGPHKQMGLMLILDVFSLDQEKLRECGEVIAAVCGVGPGRAATSDDTPVTVIGHNRSASSASESDWTVGSVANGGGDAKKRCMGPPSQWG